MFQKLEEVDARYQELNSMLADPVLTSDPDQLRKIAQEHAQLAEIVNTFREFKLAGEQLEMSKMMLAGEDDPEIKEMAREEVNELEKTIAGLEVTLQKLLLPRDPLDDKNIYIEIRAAAGGDEASLFAADMMRMYTRYAEGRGWRIKLTDENSTDQGGFKQVVALVEGDGVYSRLKFESGTHRVQRVPATESQGRIHTSTITIAIIPEIDDDISVELHTNELRIDTYRASGAGGQHVNRTDSAVRITHLPSGLVVQCQNERSQIKNKASAMKELKARLLAAEIERQRASVAGDRRAQVGTGDRSERIRTYNYPQSRITDHRIGYTTHKLDQIMNGDADEIIEPLITHYQAEELQNLSSSS